MLTTRCAPALPTLDRVTWPIAPTDGKCWYGEVVEVHILRLSFARSRRCSHGHPKSGRLVQQHGLGVLLGRFWTEEISRKRREGVLKGWKSVCEIRLKQELFGCCHLHWHDKARICFTLVKARAADLWWTPWFAHLAWIKHQCARTEWNRTEGSWPREGREETNLKWYMINIYI